MLLHPTGCKVFNDKIVAAAKIQSHDTKVQLYTEQACHFCSHMYAMFDQMIFNMYINDLWVIEQHDEVIN